MQLLIVQTCAPDYRLEFFEELDGLVGGMTVAAGKGYFTSPMVNAAIGRRWHLLIKNTFFWKNSFLWQSGILTRAIRAGVVVAEWNPRVLSTWIIILVRAALGRPTLLWGHSRSQFRNSRVHQAIRDTMARISSGVIAYTTPEALSIRVRNRGLPVWVAPNSGVLKRSIQLPEQIGAGQSDVLFVGRLIPDKKPMLLVEAWALLGKNRPAGARLMIVGDGIERARIEAFVKKAGIEESVKIIGHVGELNRLAEFYDRALVSISAGYVGLSAIQSFAFGVPMLISRDEKHSPEIAACVEEVNCRYFATDAAEALAEAIIGFFRDQTRWREARPSISQHALENYSVERMAAGYYQAVEGLLDQRLPSRRIALVWEHFGPYHLARYRALREACPENRVIALEMSSGTSTYKWSRESDASEVHSLEYEKPAEDLTATQVYLRARRFFKKCRIGAVFVPSYWPPTAFAIMLAARSVGAAVILMNESHELTAKAAGIGAWSKRKIIGSADAALVGGSPHKTYIESMGLNPSRIFLGYDAIDNKFYNASARDARIAGGSTRDKLGLPHRYFLSVGRIEPKKNIVTLVRAYIAARIGATSGFPRLVIVGSGSMMNAVREICLSASLVILERSSGSAETEFANADVYLLGFRQIRELPSIYAFADAFILPSSEEEWGLVVNEAMASGIPVVVSQNAGCAADLVSDGINGYRFDPFDIEQLARQLRKLSEDEDLRRSMGRAALETISVWGCNRFGAGGRSAFAAATDQHREQLVN